MARKSEERIRKEKELKLKRKREQEEAVALALKEGESDSFLNSVVKKSLGIVSNIGEVVDKFTAAPVRAGVGAAIEEEGGILDKAGAFGSGFIEQFGEDPGKAPGGQEVFDKATEGIPADLLNISPFLGGGMFPGTGGKGPVGNINQLPTVREVGGFATDVGLDLLNIFPGLSAASKGAKALKLGRAAESLDIATKLPGNALGRLEGLPNTALKTAVQATTGKPAEALEQFGLGFSKGAKRLKEAKPDEIGVELLRTIDNIDDVIPEADVIRKTLEQMPQINTKPIADGMRKGKIKTPFDDPDFLINERIDRAAQNIENMGSIPASEFRDLRKELDKFIPSTVEGFSTLQKSFLNGRTAGAAELVKVAEASGNKQWATTMKSFSEKLGKLEKIKTKFGASAINREERAEKFIAGLFNKNNKIRQKNLKEFDDIFGFDFSTKAEEAFKAGKLGPEGIPPVLRGSEGGGSLGGVAAVATSPFTSPRGGAALLGATQELTKGVQAATKATLSPLGVGTLDAARLTSIRKRQEEERNK